MSNGIIGGVQFNDEDVVLVGAQITTSWSERISASKQITTSWSQRYVVHSSRRTTWSIDYDCTTMLFSPAADIDQQSTYSPQTVQNTSATIQRGYLTTAAMISEAKANLAIAENNLQTLRHTAASNLTIAVAAQSVYVQQQQLNTLLIKYKQITHNTKFGAFIPRITYCQLISKPSRF